MIPLPRSVLPLLALASLAGCAPAFSTRGDATTARVAYIETLRARGNEVPAARWQAAATEALRAPTAVVRPFREALLVGGEAPAALGYEFAVERSGEVRVSARAEERGSPLFLELYRRDAKQLVRVAEGSEEVTALSREGGSYVLLVQPGLGVAGLVAIVIDGPAAVAKAEPAPAPERSGSAFMFPVAERGMGAIRSRFGASRDGGRRSHEGVDIFAPFGTPVLAAAAGRITDVASTAVGGLVIWLRPFGSAVELYYAHLQEQLVRRGDVVEAGQEIGRVGNTGNARGGSPHLHFGIYLERRQAVDPEPLLAGPPPVRLAEAEPRPPEPAPSVETTSAELLGEWANVAADGTALRSAPLLEAERRGLLLGGTRVRIVGVSPAFYRVQLPNGSAGFIAGRGVARGNARAGASR